MQNNLCLSVNSSFSAGTLATLFLLCLSSCWPCFFVATFLRCVASFGVALRCHCSLFLRLRIVESFMSCLAAKSLKLMSVDSHSCRISSQLGIYISHHRPSYIY